MPQIHEDHGPNNPDCMCDFLIEILSYAQAYLATKGFGQNTKSLIIDTMKRVPASIATAHQLDLPPLEIGIALGRVITLNHTPSNN